MASSIALKYRQVILLHLNLKKVPKLTIVSLNREVLMIINYLKDLISQKNFYYYNEKREFAKNQIIGKEKYNLKTYSYYF